jgi:XTP/dITP diphosphohydrolase
MRIVVATNNEHKKRELQEIFGSHELCTPNDLGVDFSFDETGSSFQENAIGKAFALYRMLSADGPRSIDVVIADDSGLCVKALSGGPGVYSARFGSPDGGVTELPADARNKLLLQSMTDVSDRGAFFVCCMVAVWNDDRFVVAQEKWNGEIAREPSEAPGGFGYDPIFYVPTHQCTASELPEGEKNRISHRGRSARVIGAAIEAASRLP